MAGSFPVSHFNIPRTHLIFLLRALPKQRQIFRFVSASLDYQKYFRSRLKGYIFSLKLFGNYELG
jgi:hypothetical protein